MGKWLVILLLAGLAGFAWWQMTPKQRLARVTRTNQAFSYIPSTDGRIGEDRFVAWLAMKKESEQRLIAVRNRNRKKFSGELYGVAKMSALNAHQMSYKEDEAIHQQIHAALENAKVRANPEAAEFVRLHDEKKSEMGGYAGYFMGGLKPLSDEQAEHCLKLLLAHKAEYLATE